VLAGTWYPGQPEVLRQSITDTLSKANPSGAEGKVVSLIVPHAGHVYSGQVAAYSYKLLQTASPRVVVLIGPSHRVGFRGVSVSQYSGYKTPLGVAPVDRDVTKKLLSIHPQMKWISQADHQEHSLEIQIPFIQTVLKDFRIGRVRFGEVLGDGLMQHLRLAGIPGPCKHGASYVPVLGPSHSFPCRELGDEKASHCGSQQERSFHDITSKPLAIRRG
jgi:hypothetical protein